VAQIHGGYDDDDDDDDDILFNTNSLHDVFIKRFDLSTWPSSAST
jgi:hypothetical protein